MTAALPTCRFGDRCSLETYEEAVECLGSHSEKSRVEIAHLVAQLLPGRSESYLRSCLSPNDGAHNIQLAVAPAFTRASGNPALLVWHARACGYGVHRLPTSGAREDLLLALTDVFEAVGAVAHAAKVAKADRRITPREAAVLTTQAQRAIGELVDVIASVNYEVDPAAEGRVIRC